MRWNWTMGIALSLCGMLFMLPANAKEQVDPYVLADHMDAAREYMQNKQWDFANYEWRNVLERDPHNLTALLGLSDSLMKSGLSQEAVDLVARARTGNHPLQLDLRLAELFEETHTPSKAARLYGAVLKKFPYHAQAFRGLSRVTPQLQNPEQQEAKNLLTSQAAQARTIARQALQSGEYLKAAQHLDIASTYYGKPEDINDQGLALLLSGRFQDAVEQFKRLKPQGPQACTINANMAMVALSVGNIQEAKGLMETALGNCASSLQKSQVYNNLGYIYETADQWSKAQSAYEKAIELNPGFTKAIMNLGFIYQRQHQLEQAKAVFTSLTQTQPHHAEAWNQLGFTYELMQEPKQAIYAYKKAIAINPHFSEAYFNLGVLYKKLQKMDESNQMLKQMNNLEFSRLENKSASVTQPKTTDIFTFVDLFFSDPVL